MRLLWLIALLGVVDILVQAQDEAANATAQPVVPSIPPRVEVNRIDATTTEAPKH